MDNIPKNLDNETININQDWFSPLAIFIIICFFLVVGMIIYKNTTENLPSLSTMSSQCLLIIIACLILLFVGSISVTAEWISMFVFVLIISICMFGIIDPNILFYPRF
jgi:predicted small integral membrane protein